MKSIFYTVLILVIFGSCSPVLVLQDKTFVSGDSIKIFTLQFVDDSTCVYEQNYRCDIDEKFRDTRIFCDYQVNKNRIILKNKTTDMDSLSSECFKLPESEIKKCNNFNEDKVKDSGFTIGPSEPNVLAWYGYIDNITIDTLFYKKRQIHYAKRVECFDSSFIGRSFIDITNERKRLRVMEELAQSKIQFIDKPHPRTVWTK